MLDLCLKHWLQTRNNNKGLGKEETSCDHLSYVKVNSREQLPSSKNELSLLMNSLILDKNRLPYLPFYHLYANQCLSEIFDYKSTTSYLRLQQQKKVQ